MGIDLNTIEEEEEEPEHGGVAGDPALAPTESSVCLELWHACAGPLISLPKKGSVVVYFPQGHAEHLGGDGAAAVAGIRHFEVPPHVFCRVVDVKLHAEVGSDEVYAQLSLVAESEEVERKLQKSEVDGEGEVEEAEGINKSFVPHMFCKTLTASDTSTHGGFSVPRRAAEDCFPPLDYSQQRPSQELIAKDLHGIEWRFRHIYRGQPRRHLLTTGWSAFINRKKLVSGDAVLFLRGNDGELRLGVRRAVQFKGSATFLGPRSTGSNIGTLSTVTNAVSRKSVFNIYYNPRASPSDFIVPYWKFSKSLNNALSIGTRFKIRYEGEDSAERRFTGLITGIGDLDPVRWPGSKWRCLTVKWNDDVDASRPIKISPWEIEPTGSVMGSTALSAAAQKRAKICLPLVNSDFPASNGSGYLDLGESARFHKVLQGQEFMGYSTPITGIGVTASRAPEIGHRYYHDEKSCSAGVSSCQAGNAGSRVGIPFGKPELFFNRAGFDESVRFPKVLQGQEIFPKHSANLGPLFDAHKRNGGFPLFSGAYGSGVGPGFTTPHQGYGSLVQSSKKSIQVSSPSSVLMFQEASSKQPCPMSMHHMNFQDKADNGGYLTGASCSNILRGKEVNFPYLHPYRGYEFANQHVRKGDVQVRNTELANECGAAQSGCRLFGFSLTEGIPVANSVGNNLLGSPPSTEVLKEPSVAGSVRPRSLVGMII